MNARPANVWQLKVKPTPPPNQHASPAEFTLNLTVGELRAKLAQFHENDITNVLSVKPPSTNVVRVRIET